MKRHQTIVNRNKEIEFSDWDNEQEIYVEIGTQGRSESIIYLNKENLITIKEHINYLLKGTKKS